MKKLVLLIALFSINAVADETVELRGAKLGMGLTEFRQLQWPDVDLKSYYPEYPVTVCANDGVPEYGYAKSKNPLFLKCTWMQPTYSAGKRRYGKAFLTIGKSKALSTEYTFVRKTVDEDFLLFRIHSTLNNNYHDYLVDALTKKYGQPSDIKTDTVQNRMGASFESQATTWSLGDNSIFLNQRLLKIDEMVITFINKPLNELYKQIKTDSEPEPKL